MSQFTERLICLESQCKNLCIFLSFRFYVKSNIAVLGAKFEFCSFRSLTIFGFFNMIKCRILPKSKFGDSKMVKMAVLEFLKLPNVI